MSVGNDDATFLLTNKWNHSQEHETSAGKHEASIVGRPSQGASQTRSVAAPKRSKIADFKATVQVADDRERDGQFVMTELENAISELVRTRP